MLLTLLIYFGVTYLFTLLLGFLEAPTPPAETENAKLFSRLAVLAVVVQAVVSLVLLRETGYFPYAAIWLAFTLLSHHAVIHRYSRFEGEECSCAPFQCKDVRNHETWVVAALVACGVSLVHA